MIKKNLIGCLLFFVPLLYPATQAIRVGVYQQEKSTFYTVSHGLPSNSVHSIALTGEGSVYSGTENGLAVFSGKEWQPIATTSGKAVRLLAANGNRIAALLENDDEAEDKKKTIIILANGKIEQSIEVSGIPKSKPGAAMVFVDKIYLAFGDQIQVIALTGAVKPQFLPQTNGDIRQLAINPQKIIYAATTACLLQYHPESKAWSSINPYQDKKSWAPTDVRGVAIDRSGRLWFASVQGVGCLTSNSWSLYTGQEGLPFDDFTTVAPGENGVVWFGTRLGAIRFDDKTWEYRQGLRWLPDDQVNAIAVSAQGQAWFATNKGVGLIDRVPMTLAEKAKWFEDEIDRYHRRTPFEYVLEVTVKKPGDKSEWLQEDSDNDGLWTSMYGAGECFAYAAGKDPQARIRACKAFAALRFLGQVTQGGFHPAPAGFVARTILPTSGQDPNIGRLQGDIRHQRENDKMWKVFEPRWPKSADGQWYWKTDTSSDELDGHYFFYGQFYDLVAETALEKTAVQEHVRALTDHLIKYDFKLVDHDGRPTRWARFDPAELNFDQRWFVERGMNSLSMLSYLATTAHITGDDKYRRIADTLITKHSYLQNMMSMKTQRGVGTGNQSDDEMGFMCYYNLIKYEKNPELKSKYMVSFWLTWRLEYPEMNPLFNFLMAASCDEQTYTDQWGTHSVAPTGAWLQDGVETLMRFPLDRFDWRHNNRQRIDLVHLSELCANFDEDPKSFPEQGYRVNGKVIPVDECIFNHWNRNPFDLETGGSGRGLADGAVFLLPYYLGLYHGFIRD